MPTHTTNTAKKIFIATAWPYANGSLHLGHVAALLGADILARYLRMHGDDVLFVSGTDCHGTPITVEADNQGVPPKEIAQKYHDEFVRTFINGVGMTHDLYTTTTTASHTRVVQELFTRLLEQGFIYKKTTDLPYCPKDARFLPDRYIEGECPFCGYARARGDQCDECGAMLDPEQLLKPLCKICHSRGITTVPEFRESEHFFLKLSHFQPQLREWALRSNGWRTNAVNYTVNFLEKETLHDRAITRDIDWGVPIPLDGYESKRIYVWFEAVCGYLSASQEFSQSARNRTGNPELWKKFWHTDSPESDTSVEHYYFLGKDNIPFHSIIWPAILSGYNKGQPPKEQLRLPTKIISSEYLTLEKKQFSKSRNWAIWLPDFLNDFPADTLRYYLIANGPETSDADFSWKEFQIRINNELIANFGNFVHRTLSFISAHFPDGVTLPATLDAASQHFIAASKDAFTKVGAHIRAGEFREALRQVFIIAEHGNKYINDQAPWKRIKENPEAAEHALAVAGKVIQDLSILAQPFLPHTAEKLRAMLSIPDDALEWIPHDTDSTTVKTLEPLFSLITDEQVAEQINKLG